MQNMKMFGDKFAPYTKKKRSNKKETELTFSEQYRRPIRREKFDKQVWHFRIIINLDRKLGIFHPVVFKIRIFIFVQSSLVSDSLYYCNLVNSSVD